VRDPGHADGCELLTRFHLPESTNHRMHVFSQVTATHCNTLQHTATHHIARDSFLEKHSRNKESTNLVRMDEILSRKKELWIWICEVLWNGTPSEVPWNDESGVDENQGEGTFRICQGQTCDLRFLSYPPSSTFYHKNSTLNDQIQANL